MRRGKTILAALAIASASPATEAAAASAAYVSRTGTATTVCAVTAPCGTMGNAAGAAGAGGVVFCLDKGAYGLVNITFSISIFCGDGLWEAPGAQMTITLANTTDKVILEGVTSDGVTLSGATIIFNGKGSLELRNARLGNGAGSSSDLLSFTPTGGSSLLVTDSFFYDAPGSAGILIKPQNSSAYANAHIRGTKFSRNLDGVVADGSLTSVGVNVNIDDSATNDNVGNGFRAIGAIAPAFTTISVRNTQISGNLTNGVLATGAQGVIELHNCMFTANFNAVQTLTGGIVRSYGTNEVSLNGNNNAFGFTGSVALQ